MYVRLGNTNIYIIWLPTYDLVSTQKALIHLTLTVIALPL